MAKFTLSPREFVQRSFSPYIAVLSSPLVDEVCRKNNLSFIELLEPFCTINKEVSYRDPSGNVVNVKNLRLCLYDINAKPPEAAVARKLLNESVSSVSEEEVEYTTLKSGNISAEVPIKVPWFEQWRETFLRVQFPSDHEFTKHYIACMIVITSKDDNPMDTLSNMVQQLQQMLSMSPPKMIPKWFSSSVLRYYVLLHDTLADDIKKAEKVYEEMKSTYNSQCCCMLQINSQKKRNTDIVLPDYWKKNNKAIVNNVSMTDSVTSTSSDFGKIETGLDILEEVKSNVINHPLSPQLENQRILDADGKDVDMLDNVENELPAACLTPEDVERIKTLISGFVISALLPFVETQMQYLNEMVSNKKGVSKSLFSATKRWFGGPKPGSPMSVPNSHYYHPDSPELQMRRLGDLCFMFCAYSCAFHAYHSVKRDFNADGAWLYYAGALEMAALSAFLIGLDIKKAQEYTEESVITYLNSCRMPQFATRLTLCATECLKDLGFHGEAAGRLLLMTSEDSDLRSALLLEEASYCFVRSKKPCMPRKYAFHLVLAGHRFAKAGQKRHSLRCYKQAYQVYKGKQWSLAEDHIHFTIGKLASALRQKEVTVAEFAKLFETPSTQLPTQQAAFLKEYFLSLIELQKEGSRDIPFLHVPHVKHSSIKVVLNASETVSNLEGYVLAGMNMSEEEQNDSRWWKLEESLAAAANNNSLPLFFKPTVSIFSDLTNNSNKPVCVVSERIRTSVDLVNILNIPLSLKKIELMWTHSVALESSCDKSALATTEIIDSVSLDPDSTTKVSLYITPKVPGELHVTGVKYTVVLQPPSEGADQISIEGYTTLNPRGMRVAWSKEQKPEPVYLVDHRLQLVAIDKAPCLKIYLKNLPSEMLCGEVQPINIKLKNVGTLPVNRVMFTSSEPRLFSVPGCDAVAKNFRLISELIQPGQSTEVTIFLKGCDWSGRTSIDVLFYYDTHDSSQQKMKYRLVYHTLHLLVQESIFASVLATRSISLSEQNSEVMNIRLKVENKNQVYDSVNVAVALNQVSMHSSCWKLFDVIRSCDEVSTNLEQEQAIFITLKARRTLNDRKYSDLMLRKGADEINSTSKPYYDFAEGYVSKLHEECKTLGNEAESAVVIQSALILFWKADVRGNSSTIQATGLHLLPLIKFGQKCTSLESDFRSKLNESSSSIAVLPSSLTPLPNVYYNNPVTKELLLIRMKHPSIVKHSFSVNRLCSVPVDLIIQNCCDYSVEVKLDTTYQSSSTNEINELSLFLWLGVVLHTFVLEQHSSTKIPLSVCVGNSGTYDLSSQLVVSARKFNTENIFIVQSSVPKSLLSIASDIL